MSKLSWQGIFPPVARTEDDFDAGAKYHVAAGVPYMRYFVAHIVQFQLHKQLCSIAMPGTPPHKCSIFNSTAAGDRLKSLLSLGASVPWQSALQSTIGSQNLSASAILEYFAPLKAFLDDDAKNNGDCVGWDVQCPTGFVPASTAGAVIGGIAVGCFLIVVFFVQKRRTRMLRPARLESDVNERL